MSTIKYRIVDNQENLDVKALRKDIYVTDGGMGVALSNVFGVSLYFGAYSTTSKIQVMQHQAVIMQNVKTGALYPLKDFVLLNSEKDDFDEILKKAKHIAKLVREVRQRESEENETP